MSHPIGARARLVPLSVRHVMVHGGSSVAVAYCIDGHGSEVAIAVEPRLAADLLTALRQGEFPRVEVEPWQCLAGFPAFPS